jgi:hypothetical protein
MNKQYDSAFSVLETQSLESVHGGDAWGDLVKKVKPQLKAITDHDRQAASAVRQHHWGDAAYHIAGGAYDTYKLEDHFVGKPARDTLFKVLGVVPVK